MVKDKAKCQDGKVQSRVLRLRSACVNLTNQPTHVVMHISNPSHGNERHVVKEPAKHGIQTTVVDLINVVLLQLVKATLPAHQVPSHEKAGDTETSRRCPVDNGIAKEKVFDDYALD